MTVLVLDASSSAAVSVVQSLGRQGEEIHAVAARHALAFRSKYVSKAIVEFPPFNSPDALPWLRGLVAENDYALIVPGTEAALRLLQGCSDEDPLRALAVLPSREQVDIALRKDRTTELARELGIAVPESRTIRADDPPTSSLRAGPVVLKPIMSQVDVQGALTYLRPEITVAESQWTAYLKRWLPVTDILEQEYVAGRGFGIECLCAHGDVLLAFAHKRLHELPLTGGGSTYRQSIAPPRQMLEDAKAILRALDWHGVVMVEFRVAEDGRHTLLEINPRIWGSMALPVAAGVDFPAGLLQLATGATVETQAEYRVGLHMRDLVRDIDWIKENIRADKGSSLLLTEPLTSTFSGYLRVLTGRERWDHFSLKDPAVGLHQLGAAAGKVAGNLYRLVERRWHRRRIRQRHAAAAATLNESGATLKHVHFVCYGNICRSPFAEYYARSRCNTVEFSSSGHSAGQGSVSPPHIQRAATARGIDLTTHRSKRSNRELLERADLVVVMDALNFEAIATSHHYANGKTVLLAPFGNPATLDIEDPVTASDRETDIVLQQISTSVDILLLKMAPPR